MAYRVPEPERGPSKFSRPEPEEEEEIGPRGLPTGGTSLRRQNPSSASPWRGGFAAERPAPVGPPSGGSTEFDFEEGYPGLTEILVPESELKHPGPLSVWERSIPPAPPGFYTRGEPRRAYEGPREGPREAPRGPRPSMPSGRPQGPVRPARTREGPPRVDPRKWFDMDAIFKLVRDGRAAGRIPQGKVVTIKQIGTPQKNELDRAEDLLEFFKVPKEQVQGFTDDTIWSGFLHPFLDEISYAFEVMKPKDIPGLFGFQAAPPPPTSNGSFWLTYRE